MEIIRLNNRVQVLHGSVNMGLVTTDHGLVAVDTGIDKQSGKQLLRAANDLGLPIKAIINTHAHADHFGGNDIILSTNSVPVYAPVFEADVIRRPRYEPEYLWHGSTPLPLLQNKFFEAKQSPVTFEFHPGDQILIDGVSFRTLELRGHSFNQAGICIDGVLFAADSYFSTEITDKHGIPYMVDYEETLKSAKFVATQEMEWFVPGHGQPEHNPEQNVSFLVTRHEELYDYVISTIRSGTVSIEAVIEKVCLWKQINLTTVGAYVLLRTPISAYMTSAVSLGLIEVAIHENRMMLNRK